MIKVLSAKQLDPSTIAYANSLNLEVTCMDFIEISPVQWNQGFLQQHKYDSVAFTSSNAVKYFFQNTAVSEWIKDKNVYSIAGNTSEELIANGIDAIITANDSTQLTEEVSKRKLTQSVLHVCGNKRLDVLENMLKEAGINYYPLVVYNTALITGRHIEEKFDAILFYSPSGVKGYLSANKIDNKTICCCIGNTTTEQLRQMVTDAKIFIPPFPSPKAMLQKVAAYF